ncbi:MAG: N-formylglutamate amidohydrolase [Gammaproteobacteria bacterium]|nr:N-formylglutamate amidohydrolase [Gammaproteobacteria bacterium]
MNDETEPRWLTVLRGSGPLVVTMPHTGTELVAGIEGGLVSSWLARRDADWWIDKLYDFAGSLGATVIRTAISRTVIDVNRDPSGVSLYPGQATTELCPTTTFDGEPLYRAGHAPGEKEIAARRLAYFEPYHRAVAAEIARLRARHCVVTLYDCHAIRSRIPRLFEGMLPNFNIGTNSGLSCSPVLTAQVEAICSDGDFSRVTNGRFKGGYTTRHYGHPVDGVHAMQMELACRGYMREPREAVGPADWPTAYDEALAMPMRALLERVLRACAQFATSAT